MPNETSVAVKNQNEVYMNEHVGPALPPAEGGMKVKNRKPNQAEKRETETDEAKYPRMHVC